VVRPPSTILLRAEVPEFVPAKQSDIGLDAERGQLMSVSQDTGLSDVAMNGLEEKQIADNELHMIRGWLENPATVQIVMSCTLIAPRYSTSGPSDRV